MKIAVVTGAAGGMGQAITARLIDDGMTVIGLDLNGQALAEMAHIAGFKGIQTDLTDATASSRRVCADQS